MFLRILGVSQTALTVPGSFWGSLHPSLVLPRACVVLGLEILQGNWGTGG